jgi:hypothetical protein
MKEMLSLWAIILFGSLAAQEGTLKLELPDKLEDVMDRKTTLDRARSEQNQYTVQIYSGNFDQAEIQMERFKNFFPGTEAKLTFETPNYKIRVGLFKTRLEGLTAMEDIKKKFPKAFLLLP